jgi:hypothetical protein
MMQKKVLMMIVFVKAVTINIEMFGVTSIACNFCKLSKCFLMSMMKNLCGSKGGLKTIFGREINYISKR